MNEMDEGVRVSERTQRAFAMHFRIALAEVKKSVRTVRQVSLSLLLVLL